MPKRHAVLTALGLNVRKQRQARELTQEALAEKAGLDPTYISGIERGVRNALPSSFLSETKPGQLSLRGIEELAACRHTRGGWPVALILVGNPSLN